MIRQRVTSPLSADRGDHWTGQALCAGRDVNVFYGDAENTEATAHEQVEAAKHLCGTCPVARQCLQEAERRGENFGVWGGKDFGEKDLVRHVARLHALGKTDRQMADALSVSRNSIGDTRRALGLLSNYMASA